MTTQQLTSKSPTVLSWQMRRFLIGSSLTLFAFILVTAYLTPFLYMVSTSLKNREQQTNPNSPLWPATVATYTYQDQVYTMYAVPTEQGVQNWALVKKGRDSSYFIDPSNPQAGLIEWKGQWRALQEAWVVKFEYSNFVSAWNMPGQAANFPRLFFNSTMISFTGVIGTLLSSIAVAYGFSRFRFPGQKILFMVLIATIILPRTVLIIPTYAFFVKIGWVGTWLPLIVPHFFANAYNVFLLRQYFMTIPREIDEAAMIDGASPLRTLISIIVPQSIPVLIAVTLFHFVFAWNDYFEPLIYLSATPQLQPISVGVQAFNFMYNQQPAMIQATSLLGLSLPVLIFLVAQRYFISGVVLSGAEK